MDGVQSGNAEASAGKDDTDVCVRRASWEPSVLSTIGKEIHYFAGHEIKIWETLDSFGSVIWPAALALCHYLESHRTTLDLQDKAVLEIGAGTGLVSIVASLLGAWVTATDLPEVLGNLRCNLSRNTRGRCRYAPQVAPLSWGHALHMSFPPSVYRYDYVFAADVVYHHDFLAELLVTMRHFCQPGTTLIWANETRFASDLVFTEDFKKTFSTTLMADDGEVKIYAATVRDEHELETSEEDEMNMEKTEEESKREMSTCEQQRFVEQDEQPQSGGENNQEEEHLDDIKEAEEDNTKPEMEDSGDGDDKTDSTSGEQQTGGGNTETHHAEQCSRSWAPAVYYRLGREVYNFLGQEITIDESIDSYGATIWPAAVALCRFLDTPEGRQKIDLFDKSVLELGAGTGLLSVVITLLGAKLTATDLPEILSNLTCNLNRNTRGRRRHEPRVAELFWGHELDQTFPRSTHTYDYVLATDVVYHHNFLAELLVTMRHFCQPGTTLVWANKVRYASDLGFIDDFFRYFDTSLLEEVGDVRIYVGTCKSPEESERLHEIKKELEDDADLESRETDTGKTISMSDADEGEHDDDVQSLENDVEDREVDEELQDFGRSVEEVEEEKEAEPDKTDPPERRSWAPAIYYSLGKETYHFLGYEIKIQEAIDHYGGMVWPAALALCRFLETPEGGQQIRLLDKRTLELGAGTGLVSVVTTLLGAKLTATDLPEMLGNLRCNVNRNTRHIRRHEPHITALQWGFKLEEMFPRSSHHYDYVLAADLVYHHDFLAELLDTMRHFCQTGTTIIFANKVRYQSDLAFIENFQKAFHTTLLTELDEVRIYSASV